MESTVTAGTPLILAVVGLVCLSATLFRYLIVDRSAWGTALIGITRRLEIAVLAALIGAMILFSALLHALWNFVARTVRGDFSLLLAGIWLTMR